MVRNFKRFSIFALVALIFLGVGGDLIARSQADLNRQRQEYRDQQAAMRAALASAQAEQNTIMAELILMDIEMMELTESYFFASASLEIITADLEETEKRLAQAEIEREERFDVLRARLRFMHENNNMSYLELLLGSQNLTEFLNNREHFRRIVEHDNNMISDLAALEAQIVADRDAIVEQKVAMETYAAELEVAMAQLEAHFVQRTARLEQLEESEITYQASVAALDGSIQALNMDIAAAQAAQTARTQVATTRGNVSLSADAPMIWPVALAPHITSDFGNRPNPFGRGTTEWHTGIDMRAPMNTPILAAQSGTVTFNGWMRGYGNTVIIDHGGGTRTLYAHNSANLVSVGQHVTQGQQIARAGSTGNSTGPHLHFEVIINGTPVDPAPFLGLSR